MQKHLYLLASSLRISVFPEWNCIFNYFLQSKQMEHRIFFVLFLSVFIIHWLLSEWWETKSLAESVIWNSVFHFQGICLGIEFSSAIILLSVCPFKHLWKKRESVSALAYWGILNLSLPSLNFLRGKVHS